MNSLILTTFVAVVLSCAPASAGEVDVYFLGGQSNMEGQGDTVDLTEAQKQFSNEVYFWNGKEFETPHRWKDDDVQSSGATRVGVELCPGDGYRRRSDLPREIFGQWDASSSRLGSQHLESTTPDNEPSPIIVKPRP